MNAMKTMLALGLLALVACGGGEDDVVVATPPPSRLSYTSPVTVETGMSLPTLSPSVTGSVTAYSITPALPAGIVLNPATGAISGVPTAAAAAAVYTITATNAWGSSTFDLSLRVNPSRMDPPAPDIEPPTGVAVT